MTATKHTPGPWKYIESPKDHAFLITAPFSSGDGARVVVAEAIALPSEHFTHENSKANAAFIVRACNSHEELLAALQAAIPALETDATEERGFWGARDRHGIAAEAEKILAQARAAIASATE